MTTLKSALDAYVQDELAYDDNAHKIITAQAEQVRVLREALEGVTNMLPPIINNAGITTREISNRASIIKRQSYINLAATDPGKVTI